MKKNKAFRSGSSAGFTLIEILIVLGIIGLIATLAVTRLGGLFGGAQEDTARQFVKSSLEAPLLSYRMHIGSYPKNLKLLEDKPTDSNASRWRGPYIEELPLDPWKQPYQYKYPGTHNPDKYDLWSMGPDQKSGTADDIGNWQTES